MTNGNQQTKKQLEAKGEKMTANENKITDSSLIDQHNKISNELMSITKEDIYKTTGVKPKADDREVIKSKQILTLFQNHNIVDFVKYQYQDGKSHKTIATQLNKIGKDKFMPNPANGKIPIITPHFVLKLCKDKKICKVFREKNLTKAELEALNNKTKKDMKWEEAL